MTLFFIILFNLFMAAVIYLALNLKLAKMTEAGLSKKFKEDFVTILDEFNQTADANISLLEDRITSLDKLISCLDDFSRKSSSSEGEIRREGRASISSWRGKKSIDLYDDHSLKNSKEGEKLQAKDEASNKTAEAIDHPLNPPEGDFEFTFGKTVEAIDQGLSVDNEKEKKGNIKPSAPKKNFFGGLSKSLATFKNGILKRDREPGPSGQARKSNPIIKSGAKPAKYKIKPGETLFNNDKRNRDPVGQSNLNHKPGSGNEPMDNILPEDLITINSKKIENDEPRYPGLAENFDGDEYRAGEIDKLLDQDIPFYEFNRRDRGEFSHNTGNEERLAHPGSIDEMNETTAILPSDFWQMSKDDRFQHIADLVHQGFPVSDLSALTHMSLGEIELIASLNKNH